MVGSACRACLLPLVVDYLGYEEKACHTVSVARDVEGHAPYEELYAMMRPAQKQ